MGILMEEGRGREKKKNGKTQMAECSGACGKRGFAEAPNDSGKGRKK